MGIINPNSLSKFERDAVDRQSRYGMSGKKETAIGFINPRSGKRERPKSSLTSRKNGETFRVFVTNPNSELK